MLKLQRNKADVLQLCPAEVEDINNIYSQKRKDVIMSAATTTKYREKKGKREKNKEGEENREVK